MVQRTPSPNDLEPIERASKDELQALQLERMKWTLKHAYDNVPHYRAAFDEAGVHPDDLKSLSDLSKFPFTDKKVLRDNYPFGLFAVPREQVVRIHASSGTTGKATVVGYTQNDIDTWANVVARSIRAGGGRAGDMVHISYGYGLFTGRPGCALWRRAPGLHRHPDVGWPDGKAGTTDPGFQAIDYHGHAVVHAQHHRGIHAPGSRSG